MKLSEIFQKYNNENVDKFDIELLLSQVLKISRANIIAHPEKILTPLQLEKVTKLIKRRIKGEPIAYILNNKEFWSLSFYVNQYTLIPRPETELLIELMLEYFNPDMKWNFLELGTGSGAIGITLAKLFPKSVITAIDNSDEALSVAIKNQINHSVSNIQFIKSHWFSELKLSNKYYNYFDAVISNPPYLAYDDPHLLKEDIRFEPVTALIAGKKGTEDISTIVSEARIYLKKDNSFLLIEHGFNQAEAVQDIFIQNEFEYIVQKRDLSDHPRVTIGKLSGIKRMD